MRALLAIGQSVWLDYLRRDMIHDGELAGRIEAGLRGLTSNPTIFEHAIESGSDYDGSLRRADLRSRDERAVFEAIAVEDVRAAADVFAPLYESTEGADGFVSIEVSPALARDTAGTIAEARRLWGAVGRPNVMIKIPGTEQGWPAIEHALGEGINVNITLLFSVAHYRAVAEAFLAALEARVQRHEPVDRIASVASFFVSRVDTEVDRRIDAATGRRSAALRPLRGTAAVANATMAYAAFHEIFAGPRWQRLEAKGARVQRPLWASTSTKDPAYGDVRYVEQLIGPDTVNTVPPDTLDRFEDHGTVARTLSNDPSGARAALDRLTALGIDLDDVTATLEEEGIRKFAASYDQVLRVIAEKRSRLATGTSRDTT